MKKGNLEFSFTEFFLQKIYFYFLETANYSTFLCNYNEIYLSKLVSCLFRYSLLLNCPETSSLESIQ